MNSMTPRDWAWFAGIMSVGLAKLYWVAKRTTPPELLWKKPPLWQIALLLTLLGFHSFPVRRSILIFKVDHLLSE